MLYEPHVLRVEVSYLSRRLQASHLKDRRWAASLSVEGTSEWLQISCCISHRTLEAFSSLSEVLIRFQVPCIYIYINPLKSYTHFYLFLFLLGQNFNSSNCYCRLDKKKESRNRENCFMLNAILGIQPITLLLFFK